MSPSILRKDMKLIFLRPAPPLITFLTTLSNYIFHNFILYYYYCIGYKTLFFLNIPSFSQCKIFSNSQKHIISALLLQISEFFISLLPTLSSALSLRGSFAINTVWAGITRRCVKLRRLVRFVIPVDARHRFSQDAFRGGKLSFHGTRDPVHLIAPRD